MHDTSGGALKSLRFDNRFTRELPADPETRNQIRQVTGASFSRVTPKKAGAPRLVACSKSMLRALGLPEAICEAKDFLHIFSGNELLPGMDSYAMCYGGHQFGHWAGQLGDGRAINLGEVVNAEGKRWVLQLKGAGITPYSRTADGLAVLRSSIREFLCSEAMYHLGVPTTRALSIIETGEKVMRDMFYDGHPRFEPGAVVCRVAPSFIRFGSFQIYTARGETDLLKQFTDYCIRVDFPHLGKPCLEVYRQWFEEVCRNTAVMIAKWQCLGFVHGVMNTDNMSILGQTIDYGPYGWLEDYDPTWTPNTTDAQGRRYCYGKQPQIALWNLQQLANAVYPLLEDNEPLVQGLNTYANTFNQIYEETMAAKLGLQGFNKETDGQLIEGLQAILRLTETDWTLFFRNLAQIDIDNDASLNNKHDRELIFPLLEAYYKPEELTDKTLRQVMQWLQSYIARLNQDGMPKEKRRAKMNAVNPKYILRNYLAQLAIDDAEQGDYSKVNELLELLQRPYAEQSEKDVYAAKRPDWARNKPGCSMLSCSS